MAIPPAGRAWKHVSALSELERANARVFVAGADAISERAHASCVVEITAVHQLDDGVRRGRVQTPQPHRSLRLDVVVLARC